MTPNLPNIKAQTLKYVWERRDDERGTVNLREFAEEEGYEEHRVANKVGELNSLLECGVSRMYPWIIHGEEEAVRERLDEWGYLDE